ncbi:MAG: hypothetical protein EHM72_05445 [Calditrichaeota bacterium]|nr:MAG: hypothetical protein EHM72_05445 [Calditrichota bacterium]
MKTSIIPSLLFLLLSGFFACSEKSNPVVENPDDSAKGFYTLGSSLMVNACEWELRGANMMSAFGTPDYTEAEAFGMDIARECIDMKCTGDEKLRQIVSAARARGFVVILTAFWWDNDAFPSGNTPYPDCQLLGAVPSKDARFSGVQARWRQIARLFKNQSDVWFGLWNEPYDWQKSKTASSDQWLADAAALVDNIRSTGAENIVVLCGTAMGQGHEPFLEKGGELLQGRKNIVFDIHAYQTYWNVSSTEIKSRLDALKSSGIAPVIVGEFAANGDQPYQAVMDACRGTRTTLLAWLWGQYKEPFLSRFRSYCREGRNPDCTP